MHAKFFFQKTCALELKPDSVWAPPACRVVDAIGNGSTGQRNSYAGTKFPGETEKRGCHDAVFPGTWQWHSGH